MKSGSEWTGNRGRFYNRILKLLKNSLQIQELYPRPLVRELAPIGTPTPELDCNGTVNVLLQSVIDYYYDPSLGAIWRYLASGGLGIASLGRIRRVSSRTSGRGYNKTSFDNCVNWPLGFENREMRF